MGDDNVSNTAISHVTKVTQKVVNEKITTNNTSATNIQANQLKLVLDVDGVTGECAPNFKQEGTINAKMIAETTSSQDMSSDISTDIVNKAKSFMDNKTEQKASGMFAPNNSSSVSEQTWTDTQTDISNIMKSAMETTAKNIQSNEIETTMFIHNLDYACPSICGNVEFATTGGDAFTKMCSRPTISNGASMAAEMIAKTASKQIVKALEKTALKNVTEATAISSTKQTTSGLNMTMVLIVLGVVAALICGFIVYKKLGGGGSSTAGKYGKFR